MSSAVGTIMRRVPTLDIDLSGFFHSFDETQALAPNLIRQLWTATMSAMPSWMKRNAYPSQANATSALDLVSGDR